MGTALASHPALPAPRAQICMMNKQGSEAGPMATLQSAASRIAGGGLLGIVAGGASHAAIAEWTPLGTDAFGAIDPFLNVFDLTIGGICGSMLGVIWALDAALLGSGVIRKTVCDAIGSMVEAEEDKAAGERALSSIRTGLQTLAARNDYLLRTAFFLSGFSEEPAVVRLVDEAQAEQKGSGLAMSDIIAITFETTLEARLGDTRVLIVALAVLLGGSVELAVWLAGATLGTVFSLSM